MSEKIPTFPAPAEQDDSPEFKEKFDKVLDRFSQTNFDRKYNNIGTGFDADVYDYFGSSESPNLTKFVNKESPEDVSYEYTVMSRGGANGQNRITSEFVVRPNGYFNRHIVTEGPAIDEQNHTYDTLAHPGNELQDMNSLVMYIESADRAKLEEENQPKQSKFRKAMGRIATELGF